MRITLLFLLLSLNTFGQATMNFDYASELSPDSIKTYLYVLSSDSLEGRETGRSGQKKSSSIFSWQIQRVEHFCSGSKALLEYP
ncbi:MAG: hypothetical protein IPI10_06005 [Bacteroidetes bacterium]|nr:hypothetical protein [Bacteroidota bacterium]